MYVTCEFTWGGWKNRRGGGRGLGPSGDAKVRAVHGAELVVRHNLAPRKPAAVQGLLRRRRPLQAAELEVDKALRSRGEGSRARRAMPEGDALPEQLQRRVPGGPAQPPASRQAP